MEFFDTTELNEEEAIIERKALAKLVFEPKDAYKYVLDYKNTIRQEAYGFIVRKLYKLNTRGVDKELLIKVFCDINKNVFMTKNEFKEFEKLPEKVVIFRGTDEQEKDPRMSWTLDPNVAFNYYVLKMHGGAGNLFVAIVDKRYEIYALFDDIEKEIIAKVSFYKFLNFME